MGLALQMISRLIAGGSPLQEVLMKRAKHGVKHGKLETLENRDAESSFKLNSQRV